MTPIESASLYFKSGPSDKEYHIQLMDAGSGKYTVDFQYGRRGAALQSGTKTSEPVSLALAQKVFNKLKAEKMAKGYLEAEGAQRSRVVAPRPAPSVPGDSSISTSAAPRSAIILPQLLNTIEDPQEYINSDAWVAQQKMDGERRMVIANPPIKIIGTNKKGFEVPLPSSIINSVKDKCTLDGEIVGDKLFVFDILSLNGRDLKPLPFVERRKILKSLRFGPGIKVVETAFNREVKQELFDEMKSENKEGVVFKRKSSPYTAGRPSSGGDALKFKFQKTATFIVVGTTPGKRSVGLELIDNESGQKVFMGKVTIPPNYDIPQAGDLVEVRYLYAYRGGAIFQPSYLGKRTDSDLTDATMKQIIYKSDTAAGGSAAGKPASFYDVMWQKPDGTTELVQYEYPLGSRTYQPARQKTIAVARWIANKEKNRYPGTIWAVRQDNPWAKLRLFTAAGGALHPNRDREIRNAAINALKEVPEMEGDWCSGECANITDNIKKQLNSKRIPSQYIDAGNSNKGIVGAEHTALLLPDENLIVDTQAWQYAGIDKPDAPIAKRKIIFTPSEYTALGFRWKIGAASGIKTRDILADAKSDDFSSLIGRAMWSDRPNRYDIIIKDVQYISSDNIKVKMEKGGFSVEESFTKKELTDLLSGETIRNGTTHLIKTTADAGTKTTNMNTAIWQGGLYYLKLGNVINEPAHHNRSKIVGYTKEGIRLDNMSVLVRNTVPIDMDYKTLVRYMEDGSVTVEGHAYENERDKSLLKNEIIGIIKSYEEDEEHCRIKQLEQEVDATSEYAASAAAAHEAHAAESEDTIKGMEALAGGGWSDKKKQSNYRNFIKHDEGRRDYGSEIWDGMSIKERKEFLSKTSYRKEKYHPDFDANKIQEQINEMANQEWRYLINRGVGDYEALKRGSAAGGKKNPSNFHRGDLVRVIKASDKNQKYIGKAGYVSNKIQDGLFAVKFVNGTASAFTTSELEMMPSDDDAAKGKGAASSKKVSKHLQSHINDILDRFEYEEIELPGGYSKKKALQYIEDNFDLIEESERKQLNPFDTVNWIARKKSTRKMVDDLKSIISKLEKNKEADVDDELNRIHGIFEQAGLVEEQEPYLLKATAKEQAEFYLGKLDQSAAKGKGASSSVAISTYEWAAKKYKEEGLKEFKGDKEMENMYNDDYNDHLGIIEDMKAGRWNVAYKSLWSLETASREVIPQITYDFLLKKIGAKAAESGAMAGGASIIADVWIWQDLTSLNKHDTLDDTDKELIKTTSDLLEKKKADSELIDSFKKIANHDTLDDTDHELIADVIQLLRSSASGGADGAMAEGVDEHTTALGSLLISIEGLDETPQGRKLIQKVIGNDMFYKSEDGKKWFYNTPELKKKSTEWLQEKAAKFKSMTRAEAGAMAGGKGESKSGNEIRKYLKTKYPNYTDKKLGKVTDEEYNEVFFEMVDDLRDNMLSEEDSEVANDYVERYMSNQRPASDEAASGKASAKKKAKKEWLVEDEDGKRRVVVSAKKPQKSYTYKTVKAEGMGGKRVRVAKVIGKPGAPMAE